MTFTDALGTFLPLILILGLLFAALFLVRKYSFSINGKKSRLLKIDVISNQLILPKKYLSVVRVQDKVFLLGVSEQNISLIKEYDYNQFDDIDKPEISGKQTFIEIFKQNLGMK